MDNETLGKRIKKWRKLKKMTQEQLARKIEMNVKSIQRYETDTNPISIDVLNNIAKALEIKLDNLLFGVSDSNENIKEEVLKTFDIEELLKRQAMLDKKFDKKETIRKRTQIRTYIAYFTELGELTQELKNDWNYWKNSAKEVNRIKVLEELSDCLHFYLSFINQAMFRNRGYKEIEFWKKYFSGFELAIVLLTKIRGETENAVVGAMLSIAEHIGATEEEFLQVHHEKWLKNMNERTKGEY